MYLQVDAISSSPVKEVLAGRLRLVEKKIANACSRAGRSREEITLVAVTKMVSVHVATSLHELGVVNLGESRPQELWRKAGVLPHGIRWHLVGHLQRNKIERTLPLVSLIHSVDSLRLLESLDQQAAKIKRPASILLEVNAGREVNKLGFSVGELPKLAPQIHALGNIRILGLMTMAA